MIPNTPISRLKTNPPNPYPSPKPPSHSDGNNRSAGL